VQIEKWEVKAHVQAKERYCYSILDELFVVNGESLSMVNKNSDQ
jgi:hypothetical protein